MSAGGYFGYIMSTEVLDLGGFGFGVFVDSNGNGYAELYYGTPGNGVYGGFSDDVESFLTGTSVSISLPGGDGALTRYSYGFNGGSVGGGVGTPGAGVTFGFGPYNISQLPDWLKQFLPNLPQTGLIVPDEPHPNRDLPGGIPDAPPGFGDPLVLDLQGSGISLVSLNDSSAYFDYAGNGFAIHTGWIGAGEGLLVRSSGVSGQTSNELLGAQSGSAFNDLLEMDLNGDGRIDENDEAYSTISVWIDSNLNGTIDGGELHSLSELGITSISVTGETTGSTTAGNKINATGTFTINIDGEEVTRATAAVDFATDRQKTVFSPPDGYQLQLAAQILPQLNGYGLLPDLRTAMSLDPDLLASVQGIVQNSAQLTGSEFQNAFEDILFEWAGVSELDPSSRGPYVDARHMAVIEAFYGIDSSDPEFSQDPNYHNGPAVWEPRYYAILQALELRFVSQLPTAILASSTSLSDVVENPYFNFGRIAFDPSSDKVSANFYQLVESLVIGAASVSEDGATYWGQVAPILKAAAGDLFNGDDIALAGAFLAAAEHADLSRESENQVLMSLGLPSLNSDERLIDADGSSIILANATSLISGGSKSDVLISGSGNDAMDGGSGDDTYIYFRGDGNDTVTDSGWMDYNDKLILADVDPSDVTLRHDGNDLTILIAESAAGAGDASSITLVNALGSYTGVDSVTFADGTVWNQATIRAAIIAQESTAGDDTIVGFDGDDVINAGVGNDTISGGSGNDTITGGRGDDVINGGDGDDTYIYARGDGNDTITDSGWIGFKDKLVFADIDPTDVTLTHIGNDLTIVIGESAAGAGDSGSVTLINALGSYTGVDSITFADGTVWNQATIRAAIIAQESTAGDDTIVGFDGDDVINAGVGNDTISGGSGNDTITGGRGDDVINGGDGDDTYIYARGDGNDTITDSGWIGFKDKLVFADIDPTDVTLTHNGNDLTIVIGESAAGAGDSGSVTLINALGSYTGVDSITFADGTIWNQAEMRAAIIAQESTFGNDTIVGFDGDDVINAGAGNDTISGGSGNDTITGGRGDDVINGGDGDDTYIYARGDGNDTITDSGWIGYNDKLVFTDIDPSDVTVTRNGNDFTILIAESAAGAGDAGSVTLINALGSYTGVDSVTFADGTVWDQPYMQSLVVTAAGTDGDDTISGTVASDYIDGKAGNDTIAGGGGNDTIIGGRGDDVIDGGDGDDTYIYARGDGNDTITDSGWIGFNDKLIFTDVDVGDITLGRNGNDLTIIIPESAVDAGDAGSVTLVNALGSYTGVDSIDFADGTIWNQDAMRAAYFAQASTDGNDIINGFDANDTITGGRGDDFIDGGDGDDTYVYARGDGNDTITDSGWTGYNDKLVFTDIDPSDVTLTRNGNDLTILIGESAAETGDSGSVTLVNALGSYTGVDSVAFADGTVWNQAAMRAAVIAQSSTGGDDTIVGFDGADVINAGAGSDSIYGGGGNDTITGGLGNDTIDGADGDDTYVYARGDGNDTITDSGWTGYNDKLVFTDIDPSDVTLTRNGNDLTILIGESAAETGDSGSVTLVNALGSYTGVDSVAFADGTVWNQAAMRAAVIAQSSTGGDDTIVGFDGADVINAGAGSDSIYGGGGNDTITGGLGNDTIDGADGDDTYVYARGDGNDTITDSGWTGYNDKLVFTDIDPSDVTLTRNGNDLTILIGESAAETGDSGSVTLVNALGSYTGVDSVTFADGTVWNQAAFLANLQNGGSAESMTKAMALAAPSNASLVSTDNDHVDLRAIVLDGETAVGGMTGDVAYQPRSEGMLAIDLSADGKAGADGVIDQPKELSFSLWATDDQIATDGGEITDLDGLRLAFDSNGDGVLDANDSRWDEFRLWQDANQNGISDSGELETMSEAGIKLIGLMPSSDGSGAFADGTSITVSSSYETTDGMHYLVADGKLVPQPAGPSSSAA